MCRPKSDRGGRRCPACSDVDRKRARDRARYAQQQAAAGKTVRPYRSKGNPQGQPTLVASDATGTPSPDTTPAAVAPTISDLTTHVVELRQQLDQLMGGDTPQRFTVDTRRDEFQEWETHKQELGHALEAVARQRCTTNPEQAVADLHSFTSDLAAVNLQDTLARVRDLDFQGNHTEADTHYEQLRTQVNEFLTSRGLEPVPEDAHSSGICHHLAAQTRIMEGRVDEAHAGLAAARLSVLQELRPMGGELLANDNSHPKGLKPAQVAAQYYPTDWIERSNEEGNLRVKFTKGRAHYTGMRRQKTRVHETHDIWHKKDRPPQSHPSQDAEKLNPSENERMGFGDSDLWRITYYNVRYTTQDDMPTPRGWTKHTYTTSSGEERTCFRRPRMRMKHAEITAELTVDHSGKPCAVHELAHRMEHVGPSRIWVMQDTFVYRRAGGQPQAPLYSHRPSEVGYSDDFNSPYQGRTYGQESYRMKDGTRKPVNHYESLSTGMEAMFGGEMYSYGGLIGGRVGKKPDPDMAAHIMATLAIA